MSKPLMPKATAIWLIENTSLTFHQIAEFCGLHPLEVQAIANGESSEKMLEFNPITHGQLTQEEIDRCSQDPTQRLEIVPRELPALSAKSKKRYIPINRRNDKPDGILWLLKNYPKLSETHIIRLLGTTKKTIRSIRDRTHWNRDNFKPRHPVDLALCTKEDFDEIVQSEDEPKKSSTS